MNKKQSETDKIINKLPKYEFEANFYGTVDTVEVEDGFWLHKFEVEKAIHELQKEKSELLKGMNALMDFVESAMVPDQQVNDLHKVLKKCRSIFIKAKGKQP
jgi:predicted glycosyltransferase